MIASDLISWETPTAFIKEGKRKRLLHTEAMINDFTWKINSFRDPESLQQNIKDKTVALLTQITQLL